MTKDQAIEQARKHSETQQRGFLLFKHSKGVKGSFDWCFLDEKVPRGARVVMSYRAFWTSEGKVSWAGHHISREETEWEQLVPNLEAYKPYLDIEALRQYDWPHLHTPYGNNPSQFPFLLCALTFSDPVIRREALHTLNTIEYNSFISTATFPTVIFLLAFLQYPAIPDQAAILEALLAVARADYYDPGNVRLPVLNDELSFSEAQHEASQAFFAIREVIPFFLTLLASPDDKIRHLSSSILGCYQQRSQEIWPVLEHAFSTEPNEIIQTIHLFNLCNLTYTRLDHGISWLDAIRCTHQSELVRCYATIRQAFLCQHTTPSDAVASLLKWLTARPEKLSQQYDSLPDGDYFGPGCFLGDIKRALQMCGKKRRE